MNDALDQKPLFSISELQRVVLCITACRGIPDSVLSAPDYSIKAELDSLDAQIAGRLKAEAANRIALDALKIARSAMNERRAHSVKYESECGKEWDNEDGFIAEVIARLEKERPDKS